MTAGKVTLFAVLTGAVLSATTLAAYFEVLVPLAHASNVSTTVTVLNTPPQWDATGHAHEDIESSTSTPTNIGLTIRFDASATDSGNDNYFLIICTATSGPPTAHDNAPPTCALGSTQIAISATTTSGSSAQAATTTSDNLSWVAEKYNWTGWVCDAHLPSSQCNPQMYNGDEVNYPNESSPFVVNHPPQFTAISNNGPRNPGQSVTWTSTATDTDHIRGVDPITLFVCKQNSFSTSTGCTGTGAWATSTAFVVANPATTTILAIPTPDGPYNAFTYITDLFGLAATSTFEGFNSTFSVNNVAPTIDPTQISLISYDGSTTLQLLNPAASTSNYKVEFVVTDNNSCKNQGNVDEIVSATSTVFRSGVGVAACQTPGQFDSNKCYPSNGGGYTNFVCTQDTSGAITGNGCSGTGDATVGWVCTFSLWFNSDPTDVNTQFPTQNWLAAVQVTDDNSALSPQATSTTGAELNSFLAFSVSTTTIGYGGLQPGQSNSPIVQMTDLLEQGNIGLNESLYGDTMCTTWSSPDSCDHFYGSALATSTIPVANQRFATSSLAYASIYTTALTSSSTPVLNDIRVPKTTATSSPQFKNTFWGIAVPIAVTLSGNYSGQDTITAVESNSAFW